MFHGEAIKDLVDLFDRRSVKLYHACQLIDFQSYLSVGGIPSRKHLQSTGLPFTAFDTDQGDQDKGAWDKVFLNMSDFGKTFANRGNGVPNPYGPILLQISPNGLLEASDVAICLRSAGASDFSRENEALQTISNVDRLFWKADSGPQVKFAPSLNQEFGVRNAGSPEISCTVESGRLSIKYVSLIRVDAYATNGTSLIGQVKESLKSKGLEFGVYERSYNNGRKRLLDELVELLISAPEISLNELVRQTTCSDGIREWAKQLRHVDLDWNFSRYACYLKYGTLDPMLGS